MVFAGYVAGTLCLLKAAKKTKGSVLIDKVLTPNPRIAEIGPIAFLREALEKEIADINQESSDLEAARIKHHSEWEHLLALEDQRLFVRHNSAELKKLDEDIRLSEVLVDCLDYLYNAKSDRFAKIPDYRASDSNKEVDAYFLPYKLSHSVMRWACYGAAILGVSSAASLFLK